MDGIDEQLFPTGLMAEISHQERLGMVERDLIRHARKDARATLAACDAMIEVLRDRLPEPVIGAEAPWSFRGAQQDCTVWAEFASDGQIAAMMSACLDRIGGARLVVADRKRLFIALWNSLPPEDRRAFRDRVAAKDKTTGE